MSINEVDLKQIQDAVRNRARAFKNLMDLAIGGIMAGGITGEDVGPIIRALCKASTSEGALLCLAGSLAEVKIFGEIQTSLSDMTNEANRESRDLHALLTEIGRRCIAGEDGDDA